ncbi:unnamed protein product [Symbiodinium sp. CCMP2592]|nr:unnamed protein product [Symbiodinium sp. CCMP2592]
MSHHQDPHLPELSATGSAGTADGAGADAEAVEPVTTAVAAVAVPMHRPDGADGGAMSPTAPTMDMDMETPDHATATPADGPDGTDGGAMTSTPTAPTVDVDMETLELDHVTATPANGPDGTDGGAKTPTATVDPDPEKPEHVTTPAAADVQHESHGPVHSPDGTNGGAGTVDLEKADKAAPDACSNPAHVSHVVNATASARFVDADTAVRGLSRTRRVVHTLPECFDFFRHAVEEVLDSTHMDRGTSENFAVIDPEDLAAKISGLTMSSAYSGVGAPEAALRLLHHEMQTTCKLPPPQILFQVEVDDACRKELLLAHGCAGRGADGTSSSECLFGDLNDFWCEGLKDVIDQLHKSPDLALEILAPAVAKGTATKACSYCYRHKKHCYLTMAKLHVAGTSCIAYSSMGKQGGVKDASILPFLAWVSQRLQLEEPMICHENSTRFPIDLLVRFLGHKYVVMSVDSNAAAFGGAANRERKYTWSYHRGKCQHLFTPGPLGMFVSRFHRQCAMSFREYFCLHLCSKDEAELKSDLTWAINRPSSQWTLSHGGGSVNSSLDGVDLFEDGAKTFERGLNAFETTSLAAYRERWPGAAFSLSQNGATTHAMHSCMQTGSLHTITHYSGLIWADGPLATGAGYQDMIPADVQPRVACQDGRWLMGRECLMAMGWPVHPLLHEGLKFCSFTAPRDTRLF